MSLCSVVSKCLTQAVTDEATKNLMILKVTYGLAAVMATIPLTFSFYAFGGDYSGRNSFLVSIITCEIAALLFAMSPICFKGFVTQLAILSEGPLCSAALGERKIRQNLVWAVKELTHLSGITQKLRDHFSTGMSVQGLLRVSVAVTAFYHLLKMNRKQKISCDEAGIIMLLTVFAFDIGLAYYLTSANFIKLDTAFNQCLRLNGTGST